MDRNEDISFTFTVPVSSSKAYKVWTTHQGIEAFFCSNFKIDFEVEGRFEILFDMDQPDGLRGSEGMRILSLEEDRLFSFTWSAPPSIPEIRKQRTVVTIRFIPQGKDQTKISFVNSGYGYSEEWQKATEYFINAWGNIVLPKYQYYLTKGEFDLEIPPDFSEYLLG
jgi:uncharacterized protein YndB with AHSA1/START domain